MSAITAPMRADLYDVVVIGGGASGLAAAIAAARSGARCCVVERDVEAGLKILATGNGRCNISNARLDARHFLHQDAAREMFGGCAERGIARFFESLGLILVEEGEGRLYPVTRRAESVRDVLIGACARLDVDIMCGAELVAATHRENWDLEVSVPATPLPRGRGRDEKARIRNARKALSVTKRAERAIHARAIVVAVGGRSEGICEVLGIDHIDELPVLCPLACTADIDREAATATPSALESLDGLRVECMLTLMRGGAAIAFEQGEVLFRTYGLSGIAALNLSRRAAAGDSIELDLFPAHNEAELLALLEGRAASIGPFDGSEAWFDGMLARQLSRLVARQLPVDESSLARAARLLHHLTFRVSGTTEHAQAHVHRGGIPLSVVDLDTCAITKLRDGSSPIDLFACGEALDMDADCGGYNLAWAWASGMRAGRAAAKGDTC